MPDEIEKLIFSGMPFRTDAERIRQIQDANPKSGTDTSKETLLARQVRKDTKRL